MSSSPPRAEDGPVVHTHRDGGYERMGAVDTRIEATRSVARPDYPRLWTSLAVSKTHQAQARTAATRPSPFAPDGETGGRQKGDEGRKLRLDLWVGFGRRGSLRFRDGWMENAVQSNW